MTCSLRLVGLLVFSFFTTLAAFAQPKAIVPGEVMFQLAAGQNPDKVADDVATLNGQPTGAYIKKLVSAPMRVYLLGFNPSFNHAQVLEAVAFHPSVSEAQYNRIVERRETLPDDPEFNDQWQHVNSGQTGGTDDADADTDLAWDITTGGLTALGDSIVACVIEGGNLEHVDLQENAWVNHGEIPDNDIDDDGNGYVDDYLGWNVQSSSDEGVFNGGHGTNVFGMIGAKGNNDLGVTGVNWDIKLMSVAGENVSNEASVVEAYTYPMEMRRLYNETNGEQGAFVVVTNASWGINGGDPLESPLWCQVYDSLGAVGILSCGATANLNWNIDETGDLPTACASDYLVSVTATNHNDLRTFSGYGAITIDLGAPGEDVVTTQGSNGYTSTSGTSFASPFTAGVISLMYALPCEDFATFAKNDPAAAALLVKQALMLGTDPVEQLADQTVSGGRINAYNSLVLLQALTCADTCLAPLSIATNVVNDTTAQVSWSQLPGQELFDVRYRTTDSEEWIEVSGLDTTVLNFDELTFCSQYELQVRSGCSADSSGWSASTFFSTGACCDAPAEFELESDSNSVSIAWINPLVGTGAGFQIRPEGTTTWTTITLEDADLYTYEGLEVCTPYELRLTSLCADSIGGSTGIVGFTTKGCGACLDYAYCPSQGGTTEDEFIESVQIDTVLLETGDNGGYFFTDTATIQLEQGATYPVVLTPGYYGTAFTEYFRIWVDLNADGEFSEDELVYDAGETTTEAIEGEMVIPGTAELGNTRMRVSMKYIGFGSANPPGFCEAEFTYGEVEDYCVEIIESIISTNDIELPEAGLFPNPAKTELYFPQNQVLGASLSLQVFDVTGKLVSELPVSGQRVDIGHLANGSYVVKVLSSGKAIARQTVVVTK